MNSAVPPSPSMAAALEAAARVRGLTGSNPWVGAVLVRDGCVAATGATAPEGGPHAEAVVLAASLARGATLYVTLEPCVPFPGKRTPSCAEAILAAGVSRVVVAIEDPDARVRGRGIAMLRGAGIEVEVGDGAAEVTALLRPYIKQRRTGCAYVIAKFAASLDGRAATRTGNSQWITGEAARALVHEERARAGAVLAGSGTVLADDPALTARPTGGALRQPLRVVADARGRVPPAARLFHEEGPVLVATTAASNASWRRAIGAAGAEVLICPAADAGADLRWLLASLGDRGVLSAWVEGGPTLLGSLFDEGLVDDAWAFVAPLIIGGGGKAAVGGRGAATLAEAWRLREPQVVHLDHDLLVRGYTGSWQP